MWRSHAARYSVRLMVLECVCSDPQIHRRRVEGRVRTIEGVIDITWARVHHRQAEHMKWSDPCLLLDTAGKTAETLVAEAMAYTAAA
jgi:hypothetical protein